MEDCLEGLRLATFEPVRAAKRCRICNFSRGSGSACVFCSSCFHWHGGDENRHDYNHNYGNFNK